MAKLIDSYVNIDKRLLFVMICLLNILLMVFTKGFVLTKDAYYNSLSEQLSVERIGQLISYSQKWEWIGYFIIPIILLVKLALIAMSLNIGSILLNIRVEFKSLFQIVLLAEPIFILAEIIRNLWFYFFISDISLEYIQIFYPLCLTNFFTINEIPSWLIYPLQKINIFEITYWFLLAYLLQKVIKKTIWKSFEFVISTYGFGLVIWVVFVVFLMLNLT